MWMTNAIHFVEELVVNKGPGYTWVGFPKER
jgi:hypothetical protein